jgi:hypothetical protein
MKPTQLRAWMQRHKILGTLTVAAYFGFLHAWKKRQVFFTVLLIASLGMNLCLLCIPNHTKSERTSAAPAAGGISYWCRD